MKGYSVVTEPELQTMLSRCKDQKEKGIVILLANTGLRINEAHWLNIGDVFKENIPKDMLIVRKETAKYHKERSIPLLPETRAVLLAIYHYNINKGLPVKDDSPLLWSIEGTNNCKPCRMHKRAIERLIERIRPDKRIHAHSLRHRFARQTYLNTHDLEIARMLLGHNSIATTQIYISCSKEEMMEKFKSSMKRILPISSQNVYNSLEISSCL